MRNDSAIEKLTTVINALIQKAGHLDQQVTTNSHYAKSQSKFFNPNLFVSNSYKLSPYALEVKANISTLARLLNDNKHPLQTATLLEQIEHKISALKTAIDADSTLNKLNRQQANRQFSNKNKQVAQQFMQQSHVLHQKLAETKEFERRLMAMLSDKELDLKNAAAHSQAQLSQQVLVLHQRLGRCRQALSKIERQIELAEKR